MDSVRLEKLFQYINAMRTSCFESIEAMSKKNEDLAEAKYYDTLSLLKRLNGEVKEYNQTIINKERLI